MSSFREAVPVPKAPPLSKEDKKLFWHILVPVLIENIINTLFGVIDTMMLKSAENATQAIAAVGVTVAAINLAVCVATAFCSGFTVHIAQRCGAEDYKACRHASRISLPLMGTVGIVMSVGGVLLAPLLIKLLGANAEIAGDATTYFRIISAGFFAQIMTVTVCAVFRGIGQTRLPMLFNLVAGVLKIFLNFCLINGNLGLPAMRVAGAALSTTITKVFTCVAALLLLFLTPSLVRPKAQNGWGTWRDYVPTRQSMFPILQVGLFSGAEQMVLQGGNVVNTAILTVIPTVAYAGYQVSASIQELAWALSGGLSIAVTSMAGMLLGRGQMDQVSSLNRLVMRYGLLMGTGVVLLFFFLGMPMSTLFSADGEVLRISALLLKLYCIPAMAIFVHRTFSGVLCGISRPQGPLVASLISLWVFRVAGGFLSVRVWQMGVVAACVCNGLDQLCRALLDGVFYLTTVPRMRRTMARAAQQAALRAINRETLNKEKAAMMQAAAADGE